MIQEIKRGIEVDKEFIATERKKLHSADIKLGKAVDKLLSAKA
jgi:hypothetical protein